MMKNVQKNRNKLITGVLIGSCVLLSWQTLAIYFTWDLNLILGLMAIPFVFRVREKGRFRSLYAIPAAICLGLYAFLHMKIFFLMGAGMTMIFIVESRIGRMGYLPLVLIAVSSPVLKYLGTVFTFPLRLAWSRMAAQVISIFDKDVILQGNIFVLNGHSFTVDPECLGLNMIVTGLILVCMLLAFAERKNDISFSLLQIILHLGLATFLILIANFFRILCLVMFHSMPETMSHEIIGLSCLAIYVILPMYFWIRWRVSSHSHSSAEPQNKPHFHYSHSSPLLYAILLLFSILYLNLQRDLYTVPESFEALSALEVPGMKQISIEEGVAHFESESLLLYIKQPVRSWAGDHTPAICWMGSGYTFAYVEKRLIAGQEVFFGALRQGELQLYTAWWYDNGEHRTASQWDWRWRTMKGEAPFYLWNLTGETEAGLREKLEEWFTKKDFE